MTEDIFRMVVTAAVALAALAFVVQACIMFALYRAVRKTQEKTEQFFGEIEPVFQRVGPTLDRVGPVLDKVGPSLDRVGPVVDRIGPLLDKAGPALARLGPMSDRIGALADRTSILASSVNRLIEEARPRVTEVAGEAASLVRTSREQVEHIGEALHDAADLARTRLEKIDTAVDNTVGQVEQVGTAVKRAVMRPVKEVNGFAAGISAAVSTLVRGQRKSSVDAATQDEEMFI